MKINFRSIKVKIDKKSSEETQTNMEGPALLHDYSIDAVINMFELDQDLNSKIDCLLFFKQIIFNFGFSTNLTLAFLLQGNIDELLQLNTFKPRNTTISSTLLIRGSF